MKRILIGLSILLYSCSATKNIYTNEMVLGRWCSKDKTSLYSNLSFNTDNIVVIDCRIDTVFSMKYSLYKGYLQLTQPDKSIVKSKIILLTQDSLVLEPLLQEQKKHIYYRCNKR